MIKLFFGNFLTPTRPLSQNVTKFMILSDPHPPPSQFRPYFGLFVTSRVTFSRSHRGTQHKLKQRFYSAICPLLRRDIVRSAARNLPRFVELLWGSMPLCPYYVQRNPFCSPGPRPHVILRLTRGLSLCAGCRPQGCDHRSLWTPQTPFPVRHLWREPHAISQIVVTIWQPTALQLCNFVCKLVQCLRARTARSAIAGFRKRFCAVANRDGDCSCRHDLRTRHPSKIRM